MDTPSAKNIWLKKRIKKEENKRKEEKKKITYFILNGRFPNICACTHWETWSLIDSWILCLFIFLCKASGSHRYSVSLLFHKV